MIGPRPTRTLHLVTSSRRAGLLVALLSLVLVAGLGTSPAATADSSESGAEPTSGSGWVAPSFERSMTGTGLASLYAWGLQYNPVTDEVLVSDYFNYNIRRFDREGNLLGSFGRPATQRRGQPYSLAVDPRDGSVYVPEISDGQQRGWVAKYDRAGRFLFEFDTGARYDAWVAVDSKGAFYVADSHHWNDAARPPKIRKFVVSNAERSATQVAELGVFGTGPGQINMVRGIAVAGNGDLYLADGGNNVVTVLSSTGAYKRTITGPFGGDLRGITLDEAHNTLWVVDAQGANVEKFALDTGEHLATFGSEGAGPGQFADGGRQLDVTPDGQVWVADYGNYRIQRFTSAGVLVGAYPSQSHPAPGLVAQVRDVAVGPDGGVWTVDVWNHRFQKLSSTGELLGVWGGRNSFAPYGLNYPRGIAVNPATGDVWVANTRSHVIRVYDAQVNHLFDVGDGEDSVRSGSMRWPLDIEFAGDLAVVTDYIGDRIKGVSATTGQELWSRKRRQVHGVALHAGKDRFYAVSPSGDRIDVHRLSTGERLKSYGRNGDAPGEFQSPWDIDRVRSTLYVSDTVRNVVVAYSLRGVLRGEIGGTGSLPGQFRVPSGLAHDAAGRLYVADAGNSRVQVFGQGEIDDDGVGPVAAVTAPAAQSVVQPGPVTISGTAADEHGVGLVEVWVKDRTTGQHWDATSSSWATEGMWAVAALSGEDTDDQRFTWRLESVRPGHTYVVRLRPFDAAGNRPPAFPTSVFKVANSLG